MKNCAVGKGLLVAMVVAGAWSWAGTRVWAQGFGPDSDSLSGGAAGKRPMTFADLQRMKRVSDPQISPSGRWGMFSVTDVDLGKNTKVNHLWVVPLQGAAKERQVTFWKEGESEGRFSPDGRQVLFTATDSK